MALTLEKIQTERIAGTIIPNSLPRLFLPDAAVVINYCKFL
jgi:hypothetical protein